MSGVNVDSLSDEQWDEWIAGCRILRTLRERHVRADQFTGASSSKVLRQPLEKNKESTELAPPPEQQIESCFNKD